MWDIFVNHFFWFPLLHFSLFSCLGTPVVCMLDIKTGLLFLFFPLFSLISFWSALWTITSPSILLIEFFTSVILFLIFKEHLFCDSSFFIAYCSWLCFLLLVNTENINDSLFLKSFLLCMWSVLPLHGLVLCDCFAHLRGWLGVSHGPGSRSHGAGSPAYLMGVVWAVGWGLWLRQFLCKVKEMLLRVLQRVMLYGKILMLRTEVKSESQELDSKCEEILSIYLSCACFALCVCLRYVKICLGKAK